MATKILNFVPCKLTGGHQNTEFGTLCKLTNGPQNTEFCTLCKLTDSHYTIQFGVLCNVIDSHQNTEFGILCKLTDDKFAVLILSVSENILDRLAVKRLWDTIWTLYKGRRLCRSGRRDDRTGTGDGP